MRKNGNINRYGCGVTVWDKDASVHWWWVESLKKWMKSGDIPENTTNLTTHYTPCRTLRAFRRHLRKYCTHITNAEILWVQRQGSNASIEV